MHVVDALAITGDEGRGSLRKAAGSWQTSIDPQISEWGNPPLHRWLSTGALSSRGVRGQKPYQVKRELTGVGALSSRGVRGQKPYQVKRELTGVGALSSRGVRGQKPTKSNGSDADW